MSGEDGAELMAGRTVITSRALTHLAAHVVSRSAGVRPREVGITLGDEGGGLKVSVAVPVVLGQSLRPLRERGAALRADVVSGMQRLSGRTVARVDVAYRGVSEGA